FPLAMSNSRSDNSPKSSSAPTRNQLYERLAQVPLTDERSFRRRLSKARAPQALAAIGADIDKAVGRVELIDAHVPAIEDPEALFRTRSRTSRLNRAHAAPSTSCAHRR